jgi:hypothetical protein
MRPVMKRTQRADPSGGRAGAPLVKKTMFISAAVGALLAAALAFPANAIGSTATVKDPDCATARTTLVRGHVAEFGTDGKGGTSGALARAKQVDRDAQEVLTSAQDPYAKAKAKYEDAKAADDKEDQAASARIDTPADASDAASVAAKTDRDAKATALSDADAKYKTAKAADNTEDQAASAPVDTPADASDAALAAAKSDRDAKAAALSDADTEYKDAKAADNTEDQAASAHVDTPADTQDAALVTAETDRDAKATTLSDASGKAKTAQDKLIDARQAEKDAAGAAVAAQFMFDKVCNNSSGGPIYYKDCDAARAAGAAPIHRGEPGYRSELDRDNDGTACEPVDPAGDDPDANSNNGNNDNSNNGNNSNNSVNGVAPSIPGSGDTSQIGQVPVGPVNTGDGSLP